MSYPIKRTITTLVTGAAVLAAYCIYAFNPANLRPADDLKGWASTMLIFIGIGIVAAIVIQIVFHILLSIGVAVKEAIRDEKVDEKTIEKNISAEMVEDEMDKLIELKSNRVGFTIFGVGFVAGLLALVFDASPAVMLNILFISCSAGSLLEGVAQLIYYRIGVKHG